MIQVLIIHMFRFRAHTDYVADIALLPADGGGLTVLSASSDKTLQINKYGA